MATPSSTFQFDIDKVVAFESPNYPIYTFRIIRTGDLSEPASVVLSAEDGTAHGGTSACSDFTNNFLPQDFAPNQSEVVWNTAVIDDEFCFETYEGTEWFKLKLTDPSSNAEIGMRNTLTVTIDDSYDYPEVKLSGEILIEPGLGRVRQATATVTLTKRSVEAISVQLSVDGGTATEGVDYLPFSGVVNFAPMAEVQSIPVTILGDGLPEPEERIHMRLSNPTNATIGYWQLNQIWIINAAPYSGQPDFNGDGIADGSTFDTATSRWDSSFFGQSPVTFGSSGDVIVPGEYTGDGITDIAVWRPATGTWYVLRSEDRSYYAFQFGSNGDVPVPADYDGDGIADCALYRPSTGIWYILRSTDGGYEIFNFGLPNDKPVPADYDGDWKADIAVFRGNGASTAQWWIRNSNDGTVGVDFFGLEGDKVVPLDYTGDGKADLSVWRPSTENWYVRNSADNSVSVKNLGIGDPNSIPAPVKLEYFARPELNLLAPGNSSTGPRWVYSYNGQTYSSPAAGDRPLAGAYVR